MSDTEIQEANKYKADEPRKLKSWERHARKEIVKWLTDDEYEKHITATVMKYESMGPFTKFLYHFAAKCEAPWGVLIDFSEHRQRVFLPDHYYEWMHKLRDEINIALAKKEEIETVKQP